LKNRSLIVTLNSTIKLRDHNLSFQKPRWFT